MPSSSEVSSWSSKKFLSLEALESRANSEASEEAQEFCLQEIRWKKVMKRGITGEFALLRAWPVALWAPQVCNYAIARWSLDLYTLKSDTWHCALMMYELVSIMLTLQCRLVRPQGAPYSFDNRLETSSRTGKFKSHQRKDFPSCARRCGCKISRGLLRCVVTRKLIGRTWISGTLEYSGSKICMWLANKPVQKSWSADSDTVSRPRRWTYDLRHVVYATDIPNGFQINSQIVRVSPTV